jgi:predicted MPP superfamily phosphohydrolase
MFRTIITLAYFIPNIYLFLRIWKLFIPKEYRSLYIILYLILFSVYPLAYLSGAGRQDPGSINEILSSISDYLLPFFLYLFLMVLLTDLLLMINKVLKIIPERKMNVKPFHQNPLAIIICLSVSVVIAGVINFNTIRTSVYHVEIKGRSSYIKTIKVAFVSDFHLEDNTPAGFVERFVKKVERIGPDLMLFGGDIIEGDGEEERMKKIENLLSGIRTKFGVYGVLGNHEHYGRNDVKGFFKRSGIMLLRDSVMIVDGSFVLAGRNDAHIKNRKSIGELISTIPDSLPVILLDHRPNEIDQAGKFNIDIQFSGHTHHGQLFPINLITKSIYELSYGYKRSGNTHFFVSSGIRLWGPPVRTTGKSEIIVVNILFTGNNYKNQ